MELSLSFGENVPFTKEEREDLEEEKDEEEDDMNFADLGGVKGKRNRKTKGRLIVYNKYIFFRFHLFSSDLSVRIFYPDEFPKSRKFVVIITSSFVFTFQWLSALVSLRVSRFNQISQRLSENKFSVVKYVLSKPRTLDHIITNLSWILHDCYATIKDHKTGHMGIQVNEFLIKEFCDYARYARSRCI